MIHVTVLVAPATLASAELRGNMIASTHISVSTGTILRVRLVIMRLQPPILCL